MLEIVLCGVLCGAGSLPIIVLLVWWQRGRSRGVNEPLGEALEKADRLKSLLEELGDLDELIKDLDRATSKAVTLTETLDDLD